MTTDYVKACTALNQGDITALLGLADALCDKGHPHGAELAQLAVEVASSPDWSVAMMAGTVFLALLADGGQQ
jgi:hypothetical protein